MNFGVLVEKLPTQLLEDCVLKECWSGQWRIERTTAAFVAFQCAQKATLMHITLEN
jgi:hypothetical protein